MDRRALLSTSATLVTAGCLGPAFGFGSDCPRGATLRLRPVSDADTADAASDELTDLAPPLHDAVVAAHRGDTATIWTPASADDLLSGVDYVAVDDAYVTVSAPVVSTTERRGYEFTLGSEESTADSAAGRGVALADLPPVDRTALYLALDYSTFRKLRAVEGKRSIAIDGTLAYPDDDAEARSELVPDPAHDAIRIGGEAFRFRLTGTHPTTVETRRIEVETAATTASEFAAIVYDRYGIDLDEYDLSAEQRDIVESAIDDGYDECAPYSTAYADLRDVLRRGERTTGTPADGQSRIDYANYEDRWYAVSISEYVA